MQVPWSLFHIAFLTAAAVCAVRAHGEQVHDSHTQRNVALHRAASGEAVLIQRHRLSKSQSSAALSQRAHGMEVRSAEDAAHRSNPAAIFPAWLAAWPGFPALAYMAAFLPDWVAGRRSDTSDSQPAPESKTKSKRLRTVPETVMHKKRDDEESAPGRVGKQGGGGQSGPGTVDRNTSREKLGMATFGLLFVSLLAWSAFQIGSLRQTYQYALSDIDDLDWEFGDYVKHNFGEWITWEKNAKMIVLGVALAFVFVCGSLLYWLLVPSAGIWHSAWMTFIWMFTPDGGIQERTVVGAFCGGLLSVCGILIFALMLTLLNDSFQGYIQELREGNNKVMEIGHVVVIGMTKTTLNLLDELCHAYADRGGVPIVVILQGTPKSEMECLITEADFPLQGSKIILRTGYGQYENDLERAGANAARSIIVMADHRKDKEVRDAFVLQTLMLLRSKGWPKDGNILVECSLLKNRPSFEKLGGDRTDIVMLDRWLARLLLLVSQQEGLGAIVENVVGFGRESLYIEPVPEELVGTRFSEIAWHYPHAVPMGTLSADSGEPILGHEERCVEAGEDLIMLARNTVDSANYSKQRICEPHQVEARSRTSSPRRLGHEAEVIVVVGWSEMAGPFLIQLDLVVKKGTRVVCVSPVEEKDRIYMQERAERRWQHKFENIKIEHIKGMLGSPTVWDRVPVSWAVVSRIFILGDSSADDYRHADACTIAAIIQLRHVLSDLKLKKTIPIVPEIKDPRTERLCKISNISSYVDSSGMPVQVLASVSVEPRLRLALRALIGDDSDVGFKILGLEDFMPKWKKLPTRLCFMQVHAIVSQAGDVLIGWSWPEAEEMDASFSSAIRDYEGGANPLRWDLNPHDKLTEREWRQTDRICVLGLIDNLA